MQGWGGMVNIPLRFELGLPPKKMTEGTTPLDERRAREEHEEEIGLRRRGKERIGPNSPAPFCRGGEEEGRGRAAPPLYAWPGPSGRGMGRGPEEMRGAEQGPEEARGAGAMVS
jgi:hypothetical protein